MVAHSWIFLPKLCHSIAHERRYAVINSSVCGTQATTKKKEAEEPQSHSRATRILCDMRWAPLSWSPSIWIHIQMRNEFVLDLRSVSKRHSLFFGATRPNSASRSFGGAQRLINFTFIQSQLTLQKQNSCHLYVLPNLPTDLEFNIPWRKVKSCKVNSRFDDLVSYRSRNLNEKNVCAALIRWTNMFSLFWILDAKSFP